MDNVQKIEDSLWEAAEKLRVDSGLKSTQYSTPLLGLVFLRFASIKYDRFKEEIEAEYNRFKGGRNEKRIEDIALQKCGYYLPPQSHFDYLLSLSESEDIPLAIKKAMEGIEEFKPELVGSLPKEEYLREEPCTYRPDLHSLEVAQGLLQRWRDTASHDYERPRQVQLWPFEDSPQWGGFLSS